MEGPSHTGLDSPVVARVAANGARIALIERDEPWKLASHAIGAARAGAGAVVLFEGASGMGKTGLMAAIRALAKESGVELLSAAGRRRETDLSFGVALQLFERRLRRADRPQPFTSHPPAGIGRYTSFTAIHSFYRVLRTWRRPSLSSSSSTMPTSRMCRVLAFCSF